MSDELSRTGISAGAATQGTDSVNSLLVEDVIKVLNRIKENLEAWKSTEASSLPDKTAHIKNILETSELSKSYRTQLSALLKILEQIQNKLAPIKTAELNSLYEKAIAIRVRLDQFDRTKLPPTSLSVWLSVLNPIRKILEDLRFNELISLLSTVDQITERGARNLGLPSITEQLNKIAEILGTIDTSELFSFPTRLNTIMAEVEFLAKKPSWFRLPKLTQTNAIVIGAVLALLGTVGAAGLNLLSKRIEVNTPIEYTETAAARQTLAAAMNAANQTPTSGTALPGDMDVTVSFQNPSQRAIVHVTLFKDGVAFQKFDIAPGFTEFRKIPQGNYQLEAHAEYPGMTPSAPNCYIQWQETSSYTGNLSINLQTTTVQVKQFYFEPNEICATPTPRP